MHIPRFYLIQPLFIFLALQKINYLAIISPVDMVHMLENTIVRPIHQGPFHGKEGPGRNMLRIG